MRCRFLVLCVAFISMSGSISSLFAQSFPVPGNNEESSLIGITFGSYAGDPENPGTGKRSVQLIGPSATRIRFDVGKVEVRWIKVDPGTYRIESSEPMQVDPGITPSFDVPPGAVVLAPFAVEAEGEVARIVPLNEEGRQRAGRDLASYIAFPLWVRKDLIGFGTLRPDVDPETVVYDLKVNSATPDSEIYVDDVFAGMAPLEFSLPGGKHRVAVRSEGFEDAVYYIRLEGDAVIDVDLSPAVDEEMAAGAERYRTLVGPFLPLDEPDEQLSRLFADTLLLTLEDDERLEPVPAAIPWLRRDALIHPDFLPLEEVGADLLVTGFFGTQDGRLTVQANLYDVQAESIRAAVTWFGTAGFDIFDAMDEIAVEFAGEVDRVLPEAGRTLVTRKETIYSGRDRNESLIARKKVVLNRWSDRPNTITTYTGFGAFFDEAPLIGEDFATPHDARRFEGPFFPVTVRWDRDLSERVAAGAGAKVLLGTYRYDEPANIDRLTIMPGIYGGPSLIFRSLRADIVLGLNLEILFAPELRYKWDDGSPDEADSGPYLYLGTTVTIGFRYYLNQRSDRPPLFITGGLGVSPLGYRFDLSSRNANGWVDAEFYLNLGVGVRL